MLSPSTRLASQSQLIVPNVRLTRLRDPPAPLVSLLPLTDLANPRLVTLDLNMPNLPDPMFLLSNSKPQADPPAPLRRSPRSQPMNAHPTAVTSAPQQDPDAHPTPVKSPQSTPNPQLPKPASIDHPDLNVPLTRLPRLRLTKNPPALNPLEPRDHPTLNPQDPNANPVPPALLETDLDPSANPVPPALLKTDLDPSANPVPPALLKTDLDPNVLKEQSVLLAAPQRKPALRAPPTEAESEDKKISYFRLCDSN